MTDDPVKQLEAIRRSGETNMLNRQNVVRLAEARGFDALVTKIEDDRETYGAMLGLLPYEGEDVPELA